MRVGLEEGGEEAQVVALGGSKMLEIAGLSMVGACVGLRVAQSFGGFG